jgi:hypothetical protein
MANVCEPLINAVMREQAKGAERLEPKGNVVGTGVEVSPVMGINTTGGKKEPKLSIAVKLAEHGKPVAILIEDGAAVRLRYGVAGRGWWKKQTPICNRSDRDLDVIPCESRQTSTGSLITRKHD